MKKLIIFLSLNVAYTLSMYAQDMAMAAIHPLAISSDPITSEKPLSSRTSKKIYEFSYEAGNEEICAISPRENGTTYRIQFTAINKIVRTSDSYKDLKTIGDIYPEYVFNNKVTRYMLGDFVYYGDATYVLEKVWSMGYDHAFIVTYVNGFRSPE